MTRLLPLVLLPALAMCPGCGGDSHDRVMADSVSTMRDLVATLETVKDQGSAKAAKAKLTSLGQQMKAIQDRQSKLPTPSQEAMKPLLEKYGKEMQSLQQKLIAAMMRIQFNPAIQAELKDIDMQGLK